MPLSSEIFSDLTKSQLDYTSSTMISIASIEMINDNSMVLERSPSILNKVGDFIKVNWSIISDFSFRQTKILSRALENGQISAKENLPITVLILSVIGVLIFLILCTLLLKYRRYGREKSPLLGEISSRNGDENSIDHLEAQTKIAEMRKKMKRKSMSRFSVDFDKFNADIHQCSSGTFENNDNNNQTISSRENSLDEISSNNVPNRNRKESTQRISTTTAGTTKVLSLKRTFNDSMQRDAGDEKAIFEKKSNQIDDWIEEDLENVLFVSRTNSLDSSGTFVLETLKTRVGVTGNDSHDSSCSRSYNTKCRSISGSGSFSDESAGYGSETGSSTPELTV